jgi:hypothetical protein
MASARNNPAKYLSPVFDAFTVAQRWGWWLLRHDVRLCRERRRNEEEKQ